MTRDRFILGGAEQFLHPCVGPLLLESAEAKLTLTSTAVATRGSVRSAVVESVLIFVVSRLLIETIGVLVVAINGVPKFSRPGLFGTYFNWDSGFYECIVLHGYGGAGCEQSGIDGRMAFFPGYPLVSRAVAWVLGLGSVSSGTDAALWLVCLLASIVAAVMLYLVTLRSHSRQAARGSVALMLLGPYGCFLVTSYAEALFLAFGLTAWWCAAQRRYLLAGIFGAAAAFTRINGVFLAVALLLMYVVTERSAGRRIRLRAVLSLSLAFLGTVSYFVWLATMTGRLTSWFDVQQGLWKRHFQLPWLTFYRQGGKVLHAPSPDWRAQYVIEGLYAVVLVTLLILMIRRRWWPAAAYTFLTMASLMTSSDYQSLARNSLLIFPVYVILASYLDSTKRRWVFWVALVFGVLLLCFNSVQFALGRWAD
ncbi:MAG: hypothetical protein M3Z00_10705 [Actinomycetota bacterium]|nr:hypothetical protein [Actinomycetota bacterium]